MKRSEKLQAERKSKNLTVTGSKGRNPWNDVDDPESELSDLEDQAPDENDIPERKGSTRLLTTIQIVACTAVLAAAVALRLNGGAVYQNVRNWYFESLNNSIVADSQVDNIKHVVIDLWSTISSSRGENSQAPDGASSQSPSSVRENGAASGGTLPNNASAAESSGAPSQNSASAPVSSGVPSQNNAANAPSGGENVSSPPASP
ncbi:hypothetical protein EQM14_07285 [Caproiciproducens sp. NJN-50]|uniref:hypothetical protein n=1 Tax=Acutalibacteraceae TaxID=3082771 RepID=UPI000FFE2F31|nr:MULTISPECIES: hypothetical protein [Acutalibacteraceae]QAT49595.1 hypothetical protein EQM14_07285 [Caproiciproducens sp. NJN-50]